MTTATKKAPAKKPAAKATAAKPATATAAPAKKATPAATKKPTEAAAIAAMFELPKFELPDTLVPDMAREAAEKSILTARETYEKASEGIKEQSAAIEQSLDTATASVKELNKQAVEATKSNIEAGFGFMTDLMAAKSLSEVIELQTSFMSKQFETLSAQNKDMQDAMTKGFEETTAPVKEVAEKALETIKAA